MVDVCRTGHRPHGQGRGAIVMRAETLAAVRANTIAKGDG
jgi:hypothetical protein